MSDTSYDFKGWMTESHPDVKLTHEMYLLVEGAYMAGFNRGDTHGYIQGKFIGNCDLKKLLIEMIEEKFKK